MTGRWTATIRLPPATIGTTNVNAPKMINIAAGGPFAPDASPSSFAAAGLVAVEHLTSDTGIATALADIKSLLGSAGSLSGLLAPIVTKVETAINSELSKLAAADTPLDRALVIAADKLAHELGVDEAFLDELVAGL